MSTICPSSIENRNKRGTRSWEPRTGPAYLDEHKERRLTNRGISLFCGQKGRSPSIDLLMFMYQTSPVHDKSLMGDNLKK
jgi:hypothetical protein